MCYYIYSYGVVEGSATDNVIRNRFITKKIWVENVCDKTDKLWNLLFHEISYICIFLLYIHPRVFILWRKNETPPEIAFLCVVQYNSSTATHISDLFAEYYRQAWRNDHRCTPIRVSIYMYSENGRLMYCTVNTESCGTQQRIIRISWWFSERKFGCFVHSDRKHGITPGFAWPAERDLANWEVN